MPHYMLRFSYTPGVWAAMARKPEDRTPAVEGLMKQAGGKLIALYYHTGEFDGTVIAEFPDDQSANAAVMAAITTGAYRATETIRLYGMKDVLDSLAKAGKIAFQAPGKS